MEAAEAPLGHEARDEVDFVAVASKHNNNNYGSKQNATKAPISSNQQQPSQHQQLNKESPLAAAASNKISKKRSADGATEHKKNTTKQRLSLFSFGRKITHKTPAVSGGGNSGPSTANCNESAAKLEKPAALPSCPPTPVPIGTPPRQHKFAKSSSLARLLGNTYNAKKFEKEEQKRRQVNDGKFNTFGGRRRLSGTYLERFKRYSKEEGDVASPPCEEHADAPSAAVAVTVRTPPADAAHCGMGGSHGDLLSMEHFREPHQGGDLGSKAMRTLSRGLGKLWWRRTHSVDISTPDPEYKVSYLGNVLTGWAKGEGCVEKQLNTLWRNYTQNSKPDVIMRIKVCASGLKATTRQHGLTEYWANRITHCCAPANFPRVFCWIYRHEGRKLKHELRCHAVLCSKEKIAQDICNTLKDNLESALREFKRDKILKQNARLSLANAADDNPSLPRRKILLSVGGNNYRPPLERSKSAPKLMAIEEAIGEEDGDEVEETNEPEMKPCCQKDSLYPAMTLGRRRCRRGHSIRRTGKTRPNFCGEFEHINDNCCQHNSKNTKEAAAATATAAVAHAEQQAAEEQQRHSYGSDDSDDFDKLLKHNDYDASASLTNELLPYFELQLHKTGGSSSLGDLSALKDEDEPLSLLPTINSDPNAHPEADYSLPDVSHDAQETAVVGMRRSGVCSDGEEELDYSDADDMYFRQAAILNMLHRNSMRKMANISLSSDEGSSSIETNSSTPQYHHQVQSSISSNASSTMTSVSDGAPNALAASQHKRLSPDSDEGSISSGCETASTATANQDDLSLSYRHSKPLYEQQLSSVSSDYTPPGGHVGAELELHDEEPITAEEIYQRLESRLQGRNNSDATTFSSSSSITLKMSPSPASSLTGLDGSSGGATNTNPGAGSMTRTRRTRRQREARADDTDSECSDESGYVEYQERDKSVKNRADSGSGAQQSGKPQPPPKPLPRRMLAANVGTSTAV